MINRIKCILLSSILLIFIVATSFAQATDGSMTGKVLDTTGATISGANVTLTNKETGFTVNINSDQQGFFRFEHLPLGKYTVQVESDGFSKAESEATVVLNQLVAVTVKLQAGQVTDVITIEGNSEILVETTTSTLASTFDARKVVDLPSGNGSQLELALLAPNVTSQSGGTAGEGGSVGGNRPRNNNFTLDGVDNNDNIITGHVIDVIPEAVGEFTILTNQYSAEYGHSSAGQFNTVTKSGTNEFHGGGAYTNNNKNFNALDHLTKESIARGELPDERPRFDFNRIAGFLGGPIIKNKLFFFTAYQYKTTGTAGSSSSMLAPTADGLAKLAALRGTSPFTINILKQFVPSALVTETTVPVLNTDIGVGSINVLIPSFDVSKTLNINIDQIVGNANQLRYRYNYDRSDAPNVGNGNSIFTGSTSLFNQLASFTYIRTITPTIVNEFRFSYRRQNMLFGIPNEFRNFPNIVIDELNFALGPQGDSPQGGISNGYQYVDNLSFIKGKHNFKTGVEFRVNISPQNFLPRDRGEYDYATLEEFVTDIKPTGSNGGLRGVGTSTFAANQTAFYAFFQDDFRPTPNLTLNLGLRYEYTSIYRDEKLQKLNAFASVPGIIEFKEPKADKNNFAPRIGLAYSTSGSSGIGRILFGDLGQSSIRAGFGLSYDVIFGNLATLQLPPQFQQELDASAANGGVFGTANNFLQNGGLGNSPIPPNTVADARAATQAFVPDKITPYSMSFTLDYQRQFAKDWSLGLRYLGTRGVKLNTQVRLNAGSPLSNPASKSLPTYFSASQVPSLKQRDSMLTLDDLFGLGDLENFGFLGNVTAFLPIGSSSYHAGSVEVTRRFKDGFTFSSNYTYSHTIDFGTNDLFTSLINPRRAQDGLFGFGSERGTSALDRTHRFVAYGIYELPFGKNFSNGLAKTLLEGFQISAIYTAESGQPFTPLSGTDSNLNFDSAGDRTLVNPNGIKGTGSAVTDVLNSQGQTVGYLVNNPNAQFIQAGPGVISEGGNGVLRTPGINNWDFTLLKNFKIKERYVLEFRAEMFNAFNHEQLIVGNGSVVDPGGIGISQATNSGFADVTSPTFNNPRIFLGRPRVISFGMKFSF